MLSMGSAGLGLVWGWLLVLVWREAPGKRPLRTTAALFLATALISWQLYLFANWPQMIVFGVTAVIAFSIHLAWRTRLRNETSHP